MQFGLFYELQLPRPWGEDAEQRIVQDSLDQVELADRLGFDNIWAVEHHFLEEYSHLSAPEVFLAACSQRTKHVRLGHGIMLMPSNFNHPARAVERIAMLDLVSNGRVEWGTGEASSRAELGGFNINVDEKRAAWMEAVEQASNMMAMHPYPGFDGQFFSMPCRNIVPKPVQKPHPPLWVACSSRETIKLAARLGIGALTFAFIDPAEAKEWVDEYYRIFREECVPIGHAVNPNICMISSFGLHRDIATAQQRFLEGFRFLQFSLGWHYHFGDHVPATSNLWEKFELAEPHMRHDSRAEAGITTPSGLREHLKKFQEAGVDQVGFLQQVGRTRHDHICEAIELFASEVMGEFQAGDAERVARKRDELAPFVEAAFARKRRMAPLNESEIRSFAALGREISVKPSTVKDRMTWKEALRLGEEAQAAKLSKRSEVAG